MKRLVDRLLANECPAVLIDHEAWYETPVILADEVCELYHALSVNHSIYQVNEMGPVLPQYPIQWIEWTVPQHAPFDDEGTTIAELGSGAMDWTQGVLLKSTEVEEGFDLKALIFSRMGASGQVVMLPQVYCIEVDPEGLWRGKVSAAGNPIITMDVMDSGDLAYMETYNLAEHGLHIVKTALLTIALMNCKNVKVEQRTLPPKVTAARVRRSKGRIPPISQWGVVHLPRRTRASRTPSEAKEGAGASVVAQHLVGGHFKTYTDEHPLLGRAVGRYWWGSFLRGNPDAGRLRRLVHVKPGQE